jgi:hypothetical protein
MIFETLRHAMTHPWDRRAATIDSDVAGGEAAA